VELDTPPTPIAITGFSGEVARALNFDLTVMGFIEVPPDSAKYALTGNNNGSVQGQLSLVRMSFSPKFTTAAALARRPTAWLTTSS